MLKGLLLKKWGGENTNNKMAITIYLSIITLNVNGLNASIKSWMDKKMRPTHMLSIRDSLQIKRHTDWKEWKMTFYANETEKKKPG